MNLEIEIKAQIFDGKNARWKILKFGKSIKKIRQIDTYYTPKHRDYFKETPRVMYLRVRENISKSKNKNGKSEEAIFAFHKAIKSKSTYSNTGREYEVLINDKKTFFKILELLEMKKLLLVNKQREYFDCGKFEVVIDKVKGLGTFIEVEAKYKKISHKDCIAFLNKLGVGYSLENIKDYPSMILERKNK